MLLKALGSRSAQLRNFSLKPAAYKHAIECRSASYRDSMHNQVRKRVYACMFLLHEWAAHQQM
jgi:hypothetical protein